MTKRHLKLGVIGTGNMAEAMIAGILKNNILKSKDIFAFDVNTARIRFMKKKYKIQYCKNLKELTKKTNTILISVKPQQIGNTLKDLKDHQHEHLFLTIAAGIQIRFYEKYLGQNIRLIRMMPNSPAMLGMGASAFIGNKNATASDKNLCLKFCQSFGETVEIKTESQLNAVTALSGSGPAFVYQFACALISAGQKVGLNASVAKKLTLHTLVGASHMLVESKDDAQTLIAKVSSKGGTTVAGLNILKKNGFAKSIEGCIKGATHRAKELSQLFGK